MSSPPTRSSDYRFAVRPPWVVGHVLVVLAVVVLVSLGLWQLRRLDERRDANELVEERLAAPPVPAAALLGGPPRGDTGDVEFRRISVRGSFDPQHEVLVGYRTRQGLPGYHVVTPLRVERPGSGAGTGGERVVLVNRGFVPLEMADRWPVEPAAPPTGVVEVVGVLRSSDDAGVDSVTPASATSATSRTSRTPRISDVDIDAIDAYVPGDAVPLYVELQQPVPDGFPAPLPALDLTDGPHLSYAIQWFSFAAIAGGGWIAFIRRRGKEAPPPA